MPTGRKEGRKDVKLLLRLADTSEQPRLQIASACEVNRSFSFSFIRYSRCAVLRWMHTFHGKYVCTLSYSNARECRSCLPHVRPWHTRRFTP